jgi:hypothetical protein
VNIVFSIITCLWLTAFSFTPFLFCISLFFGVSQFPPLVFVLYISPYPLYIFISASLFSKSRDFLKSHFCEYTITITLYMPSVQRSLYFFFLFKTLMVILFKNLMGIVLVNVYEIFISYMLLRKPCCHLNIVVTNFYLPPIWPML